MSHTSDDKRDTSGRFVEGNHGGPGGPGNRFTGPEYRDALAKAISAEDMVAVIEVLKEQALAGKRWAVIYLLDRLLGKPQESVQMALSGPRGGPIDVLAHLSVDKLAEVARGNSDDADTG